MTLQMTLRLSLLEQTSQQQKLIVPVFLDNLSGERLEEQLNDVIATDVLLKGRKRRRQTSCCKSAHYLTTTKHTVFKN